MRLPSAEIDLLDPDRFQRGEHHAMFTTLRATDGGIHWHDETDGGPGFWVITRIEHLREVNRNPEIFSSNVGGTQIADPAEGDLQTAVNREYLMLDMDPPKHTRYRMLVNRGFTPRMIGLLDEYLLNRTRIIIDNVCERGSCDFVTDIAAELPLQAIAEMMGVPVEDRMKIFDWTNKMIGRTDPEFVGDQAEVDQAFVELYQYSHALQTDRRDKPAQDIVTTLLNSTIEGDKLSEIEFDMFFLLLSVAGNETTRNSMSHGMHALLTNPEQWAKFKSDPDRYMDGAIEEILRWASPVLHFRRTATQDYRMGDVDIKAGDKLVIWHISANRDEAAFDEPFTFDIERTPNDHVAFGGGGPHFCLGANLARMELQLMFKEIAQRLPDMQLAGDPQYLRSFFIGGVKHLPITYSPTPSTNTVPLDRLGAAATGDTKGYGHR